MKSIFKFSLLLTFTVLSFNISAQNPNLGLLLQPSLSTSEGYTLFSPEFNNNAYLINNCGEVIRKWTFFEKPGATCYLLENGNILRAGKDSLTVKDWNDNYVWSFNTTVNGINQNHDIEPLPNGNVLCVVSNNIPAAQMIDMGRNPALIATFLKVENIVEVMPVGLHGGAVVWEWSFLDHLIQDFDSTKINYGVVEDHPELMDVNANISPATNWSHMNAVDYNADLDQIMISGRQLNEIFIIDHSTTTAEAASHSGGNSNKGGDFLWRWGNPKAYRQGTAADQKLFMQHDAKWVEKGYPDEGKISVYNNGDSTATQSKVHLLIPEIVNGDYTLVNGKFAPLDYDWTWSGSIFGRVMLEGKKSGVQAQQNGNITITEASLGRVSEITKSGELLWSYRNPVGQTIYNQGDSIISSYNSIYKAEKYPVNFPGFAGKDMTPQNIIENVNTISQACSAATGIEKQFSDDLFILNPSSNGKIIFNENIVNSNIRICDVRGNVVFTKDNFYGNTLNTNLKQAVYFLQVFTNNQWKAFKVISQ